MAKTGKKRYTKQVPSNLLELVMLTNPLDEDLINEGESHVPEHFGRMLFAKMIHTSYCDFNFSKISY